MAALNENENSFILGVVEGFYGRTWSQEQRENLFSLMKDLEMNTYMYAPKDDTKHRMCWRQLYSDFETEQLKFLLEAAHAHEINFVYALSPGLDICFSDEHDIDCLKKKLEQVMNLGCQCFALLFDDIDVEMNPNDKPIFKNTAEAQVHVTNEVYKHLNEPKLFFFCPTEYCSTRAVPNVYSSEYLQTLGEKLIPEIEIFWTGPQVIAATLSHDHLTEVGSVLKRNPLIWDNFHANDYDQKRVFLGPYSGRDESIVPKLSGVLSNPNNQYEANYVPFHTLAEWCRCYKKQTKYNSQEATKAAVKAWYSHICTKRYLDTEQVYVNSFSDDDSAIVECLDCSQSVNSLTTVSDNDSGIIDMAVVTCENLTEPMKVVEEEDLQTLVDYFYTPFLHGDIASKLLEDLTWLRVNDKFLLKKDDNIYMDDGCVDDWKQMKSNVLATVQTMDKQLQRLLNMPNQLALLELLIYIKELRIILSLVVNHIEWLECYRASLQNQACQLISSNFTWANPAYQNAFMSGLYEPWMFRGGLLSEIQRLLSIDGAQDLTVSSAVSVKFEDMHLIDAIKFEELEAFAVKDELSKKIASDTECIKHSFKVIDSNDDKILAYIVSSPDTNKLSDIPQLPENLSEQYPSLISLKILESLCDEDSSATKRLLACALTSLRQVGVRGVYSLIETDKFNLELYRKLGLNQVHSNEQYTFVARFF